MTAAIFCIPESITVHLGAPSSPTANVTIAFPNYVKTVAAGVLYPTWEESALRSNILAIISFALNRIYTEFYRSRGYSFDITSSAVFDQSFVNGRNYFDLVSQLVGEIFNDYIRQQDLTEPLAAAFCNGTTVSCDGLSQWGAQKLAKQGYNSAEILKSYYGNDIDLVQDAPIRANPFPYPGTPLREGDTGANVTFLQSALNRVSQNYPSIPKVNPVDGIFGFITRSAVETLQQVFGLTVNGTVGKATWYQIVRLYTASKALTQARNEGQAFLGAPWSYPDILQKSSSGIQVNMLQYMLSVLSKFHPLIPPVEISGTFDAATQDAVLSFEQMSRLPVTGVVTSDIWDALYNAYSGIEQLIFTRCALFPYPDDLYPANSIRTLQRQLQTIAEAQPELQQPALTGRPDQQTRQSLRQFQKSAGLPVTGQIDEATKNMLASQSGELRFARSSRFMQFPGYDLRFGMKDSAQEAICK